MYSGRSVENRRSLGCYLQAACSQLQAISVTPDFSAFSQYSPQYLLSLIAGHSHGPWAHFLLSAIKHPPAFSIENYLLASSHARTVPASGQAVHGASRTTIVRRRSPNVSTIGLSN